MRSAFGGFAVGRLAFRFSSGVRLRAGGSCGGAVVANAENRYDGARQIQYALLALDRIDMVVEELSAEQNWARKAIHDDEANRIRCVS